MKAKKCYLSCNCNKTIKPIFYCQHVKTILRTVHIATGLINTTGLEKKGKIDRCEERARALGNRNSYCLMKKNNSLTESFFRRTH